MLPQEDLTAAEPRPTTTSAVVDVCGLGPCLIEPSKPSEAASGQDVIFRDRIPTVLSKEWPYSMKHVGLSVKWLDCQPDKVRRAPHWCSLPYSCVSTRTARPIGALLPLLQFRCGTISPSQRRRSGVSSAQAAPCSERSSRLRAATSS